MSHQESYYLNANDDGSVTMASTSTVFGPKPPTLVKQLGSLHLFYTPGYTGYVCRGCANSYEPAEFMLIRVHAVEPGRSGKPAVPGDRTKYRGHVIMTRQPGRRRKTIEPQILEYMEELHKQIEAEPKAVLHVIS